MFICSARRFRPSTGASPATLLAVVLGFVSESCTIFSKQSGRRVLTVFYVLCSQVCRGCTAGEELACLSRRPSFTTAKHASMRASLEGALRVCAPLTPNFLKPFILSSWSCISTSSCVEASAVEGSDSRPLLFRAMLPVWAVRRVLVVQMLGTCWAKSAGKLPDYLERVGDGGGGRVGGVVARGRVE